MKSASTSIGGLMFKRRWQSARDPHHFHVANPPGDSRAPDPGLEPRRTPFRDTAGCLIHFRPPSRTSRDCDILIGASVLKWARGLEAIEDWVYRLK